jgi:hypothetical protein
LDASENLHFRPILSEDLQQCINGEFEKNKTFCRICQKVKKKAKCVRKEDDNEDLLLGPGKY